MTDRNDDVLRDFTEKEVECYRLWFEFLKLSDKAKWSADVALHFDLDYFRDERCSFDDWWPSHQYLFKKFKDVVPIVEIKSFEDYLRGQDDGSVPEMPVVAVFVHMWATKDDIKAAFEEILRKYHKGKRGRPPFDGTGNVYNFYKRPDIDMLKKTLAVFKAKINPKNEGKSLWQIEEEASKEMPVMDKSSKFATYIWKLPQSEISSEIIEKRRNAQCITIGRYLSCAEDILKNVVEGHFPVYTIDPNKLSTE